MFGEGLRRLNLLRGSIPTALSRHSCREGSGDSVEPLAPEWTLLVMRLSVDPSDELLWRSACSGDADAFEVVFRRHCDAVHTQCARRAGSYVAADDLVSKVFLEAWRKRERVRFVDGSLRPWLLVVASNVARNHVRAQGRYAAMIRRLPIPDQDGSTELDARLDALALAPLLADALSRLNRSEQTLVSLCDLSGYSQRDAAEILGIPVGTVKSRLSRAHHKLRTHLGDSAGAALGLDMVGDSLLEVES